MLTKIDEFAAQICELGRTLFREDFGYEKCNYSMHDAYFVKQLFQGVEEPVFYKFCVSNVQGREVGIEKVEFELMEGINGVEFVCQDGSILQSSDIDKLKDSQKCSFGQRSNCKGIKWGGDGESDWQLVHFFRTGDLECTKEFLEALYRFKNCKDIIFRAQEIENMEARLYQKIKHLFKEETYIEWYFPSFDTEDEFGYRCIAFYFNNMDITLQLRIYSHKCELVCEKPIAFWRNSIREFSNRINSEKYQDEMIQLERQFIKELVRKDANSIVLCGNAEPDKGITIGEFKTEDVETAEYFLERLLFYTQDIMKERLWMIKNDQRERKNNQEKWLV